MSPKAVKSKKRQLLDVQGNFCFYCGKPMLLDKRRCRRRLYASLEHLVPKSQGGTNDIGNLVLAHRSCNWMRSSKPIEEFVEELFG